MDFVGNAFAPNVLMLRQRFQRMAAERVRGGMEPLAYRFPDRQGKAGEPSQLAHDLAGEAPDLRAGMGFGPYLDAADRVLAFPEVEAGPYEACLPDASRVSPLFSQAGIAGAGPSAGPAKPEARASAARSKASDADGSPQADIKSPPADAGVGVGGRPSPVMPYAVSPFVLVADPDLLGDVPIPRSWEDLLDPAYRGRVVVTPEDPAHNVAYLSMRSLFGARGLERFAANIAACASAAVMGRAFAKGRRSVGGVYVTPLFFARCTHGASRLECVIPREGALSLPLWLALQSDAAQDSPAREIAAYLTGPSFAEESGRLCMPAIDAASDPVTPSDLHLHWVGWEFLRGLDAESYARDALACAGHVGEVAEL